jgi:hypothetical protein
MATDREGNTFEQRIRGWLGDKQDQFDVILVAYSVQTPAEFLRNAAAQSKGRVDLGPHRELLKRLQVTSTFYGAVVIARFAGKRPAVTARTQKAPQASAETVDWFVHWTTAAAADNFDECLLKSRPRVSPRLVLNIQHTVRDGALTPSRFELRSDFPYTVAAACPAYLPAIADACNGKRTVRKIYAELTQNQVIPPEMTQQQFLQNVRTLISYGFLELDEFRLPDK